MKVSLTFSFSPTLTSCISSTPAGAVAAIPLTYPPGAESMPIFLDDTRCVGNESRLLNCSARAVGTHNCRHAEDSGVKCQRESEGGRKRERRRWKKKGGDEGKKRYIRRRKGVVSIRSWRRGNVKRKSSRKRTRERMAIKEGVRGRRKRSRRGGEGSEQEKRKERINNLRSVHTAPRIQI